MMCCICHLYVPATDGKCDVCFVAQFKGVFQYSGQYDAKKDEYIPDCKICYGEGWCRRPISGNITPCQCNPEHLKPMDKYDWALEQLTAQGEVTFKVFGSSMTPLIKSQQPHG